MWRKTSSKLAQLRDLAGCSQFGCRKTVGLMKGNMTVGLEVNRDPKCNMYTQWLFQNL